MTKEAILRTASLISLAAVSIFFLVTGVAGILGEESGASVFLLLALTGTALFFLGTGGVFLPSRAESKNPDMHTQELEDSKNRFEELLRENYVSSRILVQRDLELSRANTRLEELDKIKTEFVSVAAHQLRTPLTGIKWTLGALAGKELGALTPEQEKIIGEAFKASNRLITLVNDLLNVARLEEGRFGFNLRPQSIEALIRKVASRLEKRAKSLHSALTVYVASDIPLLSFDEEKMDIAIENLLDNAIKYTPAGGSIAVEARRENKKAVIAVRDSGIGIPHDQAYRLFTKFFRAKNAQLFQTSGTGLGLYLTKNIVERHGGTLAFKSVEGHGTTFYLTLPIPKEQAPMSKSQ